MKTVASFPDTVSASIVKGMLESNGIPASIDNQAMSALYPAPMSGAWSVALSVNDEDYERARELLASHGDLGWAERKENVKIGKSDHFLKILRNFADKILHIVSAS